MLCRTSNPTNHTAKKKTRHDESNAVGKPAKSGFSSVESRREVHATGRPEFLQ